jgi:hypothetical protein
VRLFLDTSAILAACGSAKGASREIFFRASINGWVLITTPYAISEVIRNLSHFPSSASADWIKLRQQLLIVDDIFILDWPTVFSAGKDRPILFSALAWADVLLTLDKGDFGGLMEKPFYGLVVTKPGLFLERERDKGRLK